MGWIQRLYETYENCAGRTAKTDVSLLPICHTTQQANIEVVIDEQGNFERAGVIGADKDRLIPCTEKSGGRASGLAPHPLADKLQYVAGDIASYCDDPPRQTEEAHKLYLDQLSAWCDSKWANGMVKAVQSYVKKDQIAGDLIACGVMCTRADGMLLRKEDVKKGEEPPLLMKSVTGGRQQDAFVVFKVHRPGAAAVPLWEDADTINSWIEYYCSTIAEEGLCYATGKVEKLAYMHPYKLRSTADKAKLISANDASGFTYRGRFKEKAEAGGVGYETTQKAHNALRWLIARQGKRIGEDAVLVVWAPGGEPVPDVTLGSADYGFLYRDEDRPAYTAQEYAKKIGRWATGYRQSLDREDVIVMIVDSATTGRMSISYYNELTAEDFIARAQAWYLNCEWWQTWHRKDDREKYSQANPFVTLIGTPSPWEIACAAYGYGTNADKALRKRTIERILPCILEGQMLPRDLVDAACRRAATAVLEDWEWYRTLEAACALFRAYRRQNKEEEYQMSLEEKRTSRDYLYGRLLAVADCLEETALYASENKRPTNAMRYRHRYANRPYSTWRMIDLTLDSYRKRLESSNNKYEKALMEIMSLFEGDEFTDDSPLSGEFLLGYYCQKKELKNKTEKREGEEK